MWPWTISTQTTLLFGAEKLCIVFGGTARSHLPSRTWAASAVSTKSFEKNVFLSVYVLVPRR